MDVLLIVVLSVVLAGLLAFNRKTDGKSRFELERLAKSGAKHKKQLEFETVYPGLLVFCRVLALIDVVALVSLSFMYWRWLGALVAFAAIVIATLAARLMWSSVGRLVSKNAVTLTKYFSWTKIFSKLMPKYAEPVISSRQELMHLLAKAEFLSPEQKSMVNGALEFEEKTINDFMTKRSDIVFVKENDVLGPMLLDELHKTGYRIFPVVKGNLDRVVGTLYLDDVLPLKQENQAIADAMRKPVPLIENDESLSVALNHFLTYHCSQFIVVDSEQKTVGLIGLDDVLGVLFGRQVTNK